MSKSFKVKTKKEGETFTIDGFVSNVGIKNFELLTTKTNKPYIKITFYNEEGIEGYHFIWDKENLNFKTAEGKEKALTYNANMLYKYFRAVNPTIEPVDITNITSIFEQCYPEVADLLPSPCDGELKVNFKEAESQYWNIVVSREDPVYTNENSPSKLAFKSEEILSFTKVIPTPEVETPATTDDLPF